LRQADRLRLLADAQALNALHQRVLSGQAHRDWPAPRPVSESPAALESAPSPLDSIVSAH
jgi:hypothetical protein